MRKNKIAVIGAGPSGILTTYFLNKLGYTNIYIYGKIEDAQPNTVKVADIICDVTTSYTHFGYSNSVDKLIKEYGFNYINSPQNIQIKNTNWEPTTIKKIEYIIIVKIILHASLWKIRKNLPISSKIYSISFKEYINKYISNKPSDIISIFSDAQGYGYGDMVTAYHLLRWFRPNTFLSFSSEKKEKSYMVREGFGTLFNTMYNSLRTKHKIRKNIRKCGKGYVITEDNKIETGFDSIFVCCPITNIYTPLNRRINMKRYITYTLVFAYLFETSSENKNMSNSIVYMTDLIKKNPINLPITIRHNNRNANGEYTNPERSVYGTFGYCNSQNEDKIREGVDRNLKEYGFSTFKNNKYKNHYFKTYKYNYRFTNSAIKEGVHLKVNKLQGKFGIYYSGGLFSHWDIDSIYEQTREIVNKYHLRNSKKPSEKIKTIYNMVYNKWIDEW